MAADTEAILATITGVGNGEVLLPVLSTRDDVEMNVHSGDTDSAPASDNAHYSVKKTLTVDEHVFMVRHKQAASSSVAFDWAVYKVLPV